MAATPVFLLRAGLAALVTLVAFVLFRQKAEGRRALAVVMLLASVLLGAVWLACVALLPVAAPGMATVLRQLIGLSLVLGPCLAGAALVATAVALGRATPPDPMPRQLLLLGLSTYVALSFFGFEIGKALHDAEMRQFFLTSGFSVGFMYTVMALETIGALGLLTRRLRALSALLLVLVMAGAIATHARNGDPFSDSLDALRMLLVLACILALAWYRRPARRLPQ
jgi:hypothetical protein